VNVKRVLVVDDEEVIRTTIAGILGSAGRYSVTTASDGKEGLKKAQERPDLILLDIEMPRMNGLETLKHLKSKNKTREIPVIMLTGVDTEDAISHAMEHQADQYLQKPFKPSTLLAAIDRALSMRPPRF
jgi:CheY-like chemotaxis protein